MASPFYTAEHDAYREVVRRFVEKEIEPYAHEWDEAGEFPRELYRKAAEIGLLGLGFPEDYGGTEVDHFMWIVAVQELARAGAGGISASLKSHSIGAPPIARAGTSGIQGARAAGDSLGPEDLGAGDHRAERRLRRRQPAHLGAARRRCLCRQRRKDLYHLGDARRLHHDRGAHRRPRARRRQPAGDRGRHAGPVAHAAEEDGLVGVGYRDAAFRQLPRSGRQPARRGRRRLQDHHAQFQP